MKVYLVGGAVRDKLLGYPTDEHDWVVVGATPEDMLRKGFTPVGKDFPVFLHPQTKDEYALARTERKTGRGYQGFSFDASPEVTLEEDLLRRDLTINAIAEVSDGVYVDPFNGKQDIEHRILRHVSDAFKEDPVRILRLARFAARYHHLGFTIADETLHFMRDMVDQGEADFLVEERVWKEFSRALSEKSPHVFLEVLETVGALSVILPELHDLFVRHKDEAVPALTKASNSSSNISIRFAALVEKLDELPNAETVDQIHFLSTQKPTHLESLGKRLSLPNEFRELASVTIKFFSCFENIHVLSSDMVLLLLTKIDALRREDRFLNFLSVCKACSSSEQSEVESKYRYLIDCLGAMKAQTAAPLIEQGLQGKALGDAIYNARLNAISELNNSPK